MTEIAKRDNRNREIEARIRKMQDIRRRSRDLLRDGPSAVEHGDYLYEENGLPK